MLHTGLLATLTSLPCSKPLSCAWLKLFEKFKTSDFIYFLVPSGG